MTTSSRPDFSFSNSVQTYIAQGFHTEEARRFFALRTAFVIRRSTSPRRVEVSITTMATCPGKGTCSISSERQSRNKRMTLLACGACHLIHDAAIDTHPFILRALAHTRHISRIPFQITEGRKDPAPQPIPGQRRRKGRNHAAHLPS